MKNEFALKLNLFVIVLDHLAMQEQDLVFLWDPHSVINFILQIQKADSRGEVEHDGLLGVVSDVDGSCGDVEGLNSHGGHQINISKVHCGKCLPLKFTMKMAVINFNSG